MRAAFRGRVLFVLIGILLWCTSGTARAQSLWFDRTQEETIVYELFKPDFAGDDRASWLTSTHSLTFRSSYTADDRLQVYLGFNYAYWGYSASESDFSESTVGNVIIGFELLEKYRHVFWEISLIWPTVKDSEKNANARISGMLADLDRSETFLARVITVQSYLNFENQIIGPLGLRLRAGPVILFNTERYTGDKSELMLGYGGALAYRYQQWTAKIGASGRWWISQNRLNTEEATDHQLGLSAAYDLGRVRPEIRVRRPFDRDQRLLVSMMYDLVVSVSLK